MYRAPEQATGGGAPQPAESSADASQLGGLPTVLVNLGCFNCGMNQDMLSKHVHKENLSRVIGKAVREQDLHMVTLCEVGGHKQGLDTANVRVQDLVPQVLTRHYEATSCQAYMATWQATDGPTGDTSVTLTLVGEPEVVELTSTQEPQLVIMVFTIDAAQHPDKHGLLISGNLHIRTPRVVGHQTTKVTTKRITKAALKVLEKRASTASSGASQPTAPVIVLTGDVNLDKATGDSLLQTEFGDPSLETKWQVMTSNAALSGDVLFVKGAFGEALDVSVGASYVDRGIRRYCHDFFGVALSIPMSDKNQRGQKRQPAGGATQPASAEQRQDNPESSASGATQPAARLPEDSEEKRVPKNGRLAYTKAAFLAFYYPRGMLAEQEWAAALPEAVASHDAEQELAAAPLSSMQKSTSVELASGQAETRTPTHEELYERMETVEMRLEDPDGFRQDHHPVALQQSETRRRMLESLERSSMQVEDDDGHDSIATGSCRNPVELMASLPSEAGDCQNLYMAWEARRAAEEQRRYEEMPDEEPMSSRPSRCG